MSLNHIISNSNSIFKKKLSRTKSKKSQQSRSKMGRMIAIEPEIKENFIYVENAVFSDIKAALQRKPLQFFLNKEVKAKFNVIDRINDRKVPEWMWVHIYDIDKNGILVGKLVNTSFYQPELKYGDVVYVSQNDIGLVNDPNFLRIVNSQLDYSIFTSTAEYYAFLNDMIINLNRTLYIYFR